MALLNFGEKPTGASFLAAGAFTFVALLALVYSVGIYLYRATAIRKRRAIRYHDRWGPSVLCVALIAAVVVNVWFEVKTRGIL